MLFVLALACEMCLWRQRWTLLHTMMLSSGKEKMNSMTVKIWDADGAVYRFLDVGITTGQARGTAETIFSKMDSLIQGHNIPEKNCVDLSVGNSSVNMEDMNSIKPSILKGHPAFILSCSCTMWNVH